ncbi:MAG: toxin-antitoxin system HicB family antitoxin [Chloroflexi bacterium]|nr:toxin-antitoxin system HicB family antitoxin [Chloroflexota bacterium]
MELSPYIDALKKSLTAAAAPGSKEVADAAALLSEALEPSARLCLMDAMADASDEITAALEEVTVEARLHGREIEFVVTDLVHPEGVPAPPATTNPESSADLARISLRLPESLKDSVEQAANAENISVNAWLVRAINSTVDGGPSFNSRGGTRLGRRFTGFAQA